MSLAKIYLCDLSIGGWNAANYAGFYPQNVLKLILLNPIQTFAKMPATFFIKIMKIGIKPTRGNVKSYIGWGNEKEESIPDSIIKLFTISVMNVNSNNSFPKWGTSEHLSNLKMPVLVVLGEKEFAFPISKAIRRAKILIDHLKLQIVNNASHLISVSSPDYINNKELDFIKIQ
ncbi:alpha/beta fold hydrolase [Anaerorhabdus sp.]|uniref:alpha/beta fold hydrolase n=1 Tax=Anaerorhabdus sp. TaxID=1872524 RepID=UPI002FC62EFA